MPMFGDNDRILILGATGGIGAAMMAELRQRIPNGVLFGLSRQSSPPFDLLDETTIASAASALKADGPFTLIFDATGALEIDGIGPEKSIKAIDAATMAKQFAINAIGPALLIKHFSPLLRKDGPAAFATLSAKVGSIGDNRLGGWISYRAAKAALNQIIRTAAIEIARTHPLASVIAMHPGTVQTQLSEKWQGNHPSVPASEAAQNLVNVIENLTPDDTGGFWNYDGKRLPW